MKIYKKKVAIGALSLSLLLGNVSTVGASQLDKGTTTVNTSDSEKEPFILSSSFNSNLVGDPVIPSPSFNTNLVGDPVITPFYIPIPYDYLYTRFITNSQLKGLLAQMKKNSSTTNIAALLGGFLPVVGVPIAISGYMGSTKQSSDITYYQSAYDRGLGMQIISRTNPNFNGYNARTYVESIATASAMR